MIFDSHAHYDSEQFDIDRDELLGSVLPQKGVVAVINMAADYESLKKPWRSVKNTIISTVQSASTRSAQTTCPITGFRTWKRCFPTRRSSPSARSASTTTGRTSARAKAERGTYRPAGAREKHDLPVVIHDREAHGDMMDILRKYKPKGVVHCFSGSAELAQETVKLGMYIGLGGVVTFKNARHSVEVAKAIPLDRLLTETDAPYMAPVPFRGKRCDSSMIPYDAAKIAEVRGITAQEVLETACENACRLFGITLPSAAK